MPKNTNKTPQFITLVIVAAILILTMVLENVLSPSFMLFPVLKKGAVYALVVVSMNLLNGFTGLFSMGQAGFMLVGAYAYGILTIPSESRDQVYYLYGGSAVHFSAPEFFEGIFGSAGVGGAVSLVLGVLLALICAGLAAALVAWLIGLPVLRLKSDYLAIATLGFGEIIRAIFQWEKLGPVTNGANMLKNFPTFSSFNIRNPDGDVIFRLSATVPLFLAALCIGVIVLLINSSYGRAFKAIREDEIAAEAMGINLARHKRLSFCISSFFAGVGGAMLAMYQNQVQAKAFTTAMTYEILLIVVLGGIGSVSGSCVGSFLFVAASEWWLRILDNEMYFDSAAAPSRILFIAIFALAVVGGTVLLLRREKKTTNKLWKKLLAGGVGVLLLGWLIYFTATGALKLPLLRNGFRLVVFSIIIMIVVLFFRQGIMGQRELPDLFLAKTEKSKKKAGESHG